MKESVIRGGDSSISSVTAAASAAAPLSIFGFDAAAAAAPGEFFDAAEFPAVALDFVVAAAAAS